MYAIVEISGRQFKVEKKQKLFVNRLDTQEGKKVSFEKEIGRAHVRTPVTEKSRMPSSA